MVEGVVMCHPEKQGRQPVFVTSGPEVVMVVEQVEQEEQAAEVVTAQEAVVTAQGAVVTAQVVTAQGAVVTVQGRW
jgi:hypothetical protein